MKNLPWSPCLSSLNSNVISFEVVPYRPSQRASAYYPFCACLSFSLMHHCVLFSLYTFSNCKILPYLFISWDVFSWLVSDHHCIVCSHDLPFVFLERALSYKGTIPTRKAPPSWPNYPNDLPNAPSVNTIMCGIRVSTYRHCGDINSQSLALSNLILQLKELRPKEAHMCHTGSKWQFWIQNLQSIMIN